MRPECLEYALANEDLAGVWGGTTERERRQYRHRQLRNSTEISTEPSDTVRHQPTPLPSLGPEKLLVRPTI